jgi:Zn-dependent protease
VEAWIFHVTAVAIPAILAITMHEAAHGWVAWRLGDDTAMRLGRVSFNPLRHIDPFGTVILPAMLYFTTGFLFGWARPVPIDPRRLDNPRRDMMWVALAGPAVNIVLAFISAWWWARLEPFNPGPVDRWLHDALEVSLLINVVLAVFNMIPLPPLDGGRVAVGLLPDSLARPLAGMERIGLFVLMSLMFLVPLVGQQFGYDINLLSWILQPPVEAVIQFILDIVDPAGG